MLSRWKILHSDAPPRVRDLPLLPRTLPRTFALEEGFLHHWLVALDRLGSIPHMALLFIVVTLDVALQPVLGTVAVAALGIAQVTDWLVLMGLPHARISFGPLRIQWLILTALRVVVALLIVGVSVLTSSVDRNWLNVAAQAIGTLLVLRGFVTEPCAIGVTRIELSVSRLHRNIRLLHVADVHVERHGRREDQLLALARELTPDAILFTGDFINLSYIHDAVAQQHARALWCALSEVAPVFAVNGSPPVDPPHVVQAVLCDVPVTWLRDEARCLEVRGACLRIVGITCTHDPLRDGEKLRHVLTAEAGRQTADNHHPSTIHSPPSVLLYHAPDLAPQAAASGQIDLHLAGHTHGGQVRLPWLGALVTASLYRKQLEMGLYQLQDMLLFVSRGVGFEGLGAPRVRLLCAPEVALITLRGEGACGERQATHD